MTPSPLLRFVLASLLLATAVLSAEPPAFTSHLPAKDNTGGAVLIAAGEVDVQPLAHWLNERGLAAFVLPQAASSSDIGHALRDLRTRAVALKISPRRLVLLGYGSGAESAARVAYDSAPDASRPDLVALIWGASAALPAGDTKLPPTFLVGSTNAGDNLSATFELWTKLRAARAVVDAHFFARADLTTVLAAENASAGTWPDMFFTWARFSGLFTDEPRLPIKGMVYLDGRALPHGYVIFTPLDAIATGPVVGRVVNSTVGVPLGQFSLPADQGPLAGRYQVDVRQNMNRWLSNSFSGDLVGGRGGGMTPEKAHFGHHRVLAPSIDDQRSFTKVRPADRTNYVVEFKPGAEANLDLKIEVFSK